MKKMGDMSFREFLNLSKTAVGYFKNWG